MSSIIKKIIKNYKTNKSLYIGEKVTMTEHMIQTAMLAEKNESSPSLVCASLLHDYGHFILEDPEKLVNKKEDGKHENESMEHTKLRKWNAWMHVNETWHYENSKLLYGQVWNNENEMYESVQMKCEMNEHMKLTYGKV